MNYFDEFKDLLPDELETIKNIIDIITQDGFMSSFRTHFFTQS